MSALCGWLGFGSFMDADNSFIPSLIIARMQTYQRTAYSSTINNQINHSYNQFRHARRIHTQSTKRAKVSDEVEEEKERKGDRYARRRKEGKREEWKGRRRGMRMEKG